MLAFNESEEILKAHESPIPHSVDLKNATKLLRLIHTAIVSAKCTLILGSGNKKSDNLKSHFWARDALYQREFNFSAYKKNMTSKKWELSFFKEEEGKYVDVWAYPVDSKRDPVVQLDENKAHLVRQNAILKKERVGNCVSYAHLIGYYLWQYAEDNIHHIEMAEQPDDDHVFVIVNRVPSTGLQKPEEWNAWIVDGWFGKKGRIYHSSFFNLWQKEELEYALLEDYQENQEAFNESKNKTIKHLKQCKDVADYRIPIKIVCDIDVKDIPSLLIGGKAWDDFYDISPLRREPHTQIAVEKEKHKGKYLPCMEELKKMRLASFFLKRGNTRWKRQMQIGPLKKVEWIKVAFAVFHRRYFLRNYFFPINSIN